MAIKKLKVVWLCSFSNSFVQDQIKPWKRGHEFAPWISELIHIFENDSEIDIHIISQHDWLPAKREFQFKNIHYHFLNKGIPLLGRHWPTKFKLDFWTNYKRIKRSVRKLVKKIDPDIIHLHGAENEFSNVILQYYNKIPVLVTIQGFVSKSSGESKERLRRKQKEIEIVRMFQHFGYRTKAMGQDIKSINPKAILHWHHYPIKTINVIDKKKNHDIVFFARIIKDKGIEDLIKALYLVKIKMPDVKALIIGRGNTAPFKKLSQKLNLDKNINWMGFLHSQKEVYKAASKAKISVLPTYHDIISGTIIESLFLKIPVVAYNVGSIHEINEKDEIISLVEKGNINELAFSILKLLNNEKLLFEIADKGRIRAIEMFEIHNKNIRNDIIDAYNKVIEDFQ